MSRILLVDDSSMVRTIVGKTLRGASHDVIEAADGQAAIERLEATPVDLVLCDVNMPRLDGLNFLRQLRSHTPPILTPVVFLSAEADPRRIQSAKDSGASAWLVKPFKPDKLLDVLRRLLP